MQLKEKYIGDALLEEISLSCITDDLAKCHYESGQFS